MLIAYTYLSLCILLYGLPWWFSDKESACNAGDTDSGSGRSIVGEHGNPLQCSWTEETGGLRSIGS